MDEQTLINLIRDMWNKRDFSPIIELVPYEQRFSLFMREIGKNIPDIIYFEICDVIFTPEEAEKLFFQIEGNKKKNLLFNLLSVEDKLKYVDKLELESYSVANFIDSIQDQDLRLHFTMHFLEKGKIWTFAVEGYIDRFIGEYKFKFLDRIIEFFAKRNETISQFNYPGYLSKFNSEDRYKVFKILIEKSGNKSFSEMYLSSCLKELPQSDRREALIYILDKFKEEYKASLMGLDGILDLFPDNEYYEILTELLDRGIATQFSLTNLFQKFSIEKSEELIDFVLEYSKKNDKKIFNDSAISSLLNHISREEGKRIFKKYAIDSDYFGNLGVARHCRDVADKYFYIDYLLGEVKPSNFDKAFDSVHTNIVDINASAKGDVEYSNLIDMYAKKYDVDRIHLVEFIKRFNYTVLKFLNSKSVRAAINLPDEEFVMFLNIFNVEGTNLDNNIINTICNSFLQRQFRLTNKDDYTIFTQFELLLANKGDDTAIKVSELLVKIGQVVDIDSYFKKYDTNFDQFVFDLMNNEKIAVDILHDMTQEYIMHKREVYVKEELSHVFEKLNVYKKADKTFYKKKIIEISDDFDIRTLFNSIPADKLTNQEEELRKNRDLVTKLFEFKKERVPLENEEKKYLKLFESLLNKAYEYKYDAKKFDEMEDTIYTYKPIPPSDQFLLGVIVECNVKQLQEKLFNDKKAYSELIVLLRKYKMLGWEKTFASFDQSAEVIFNEGTMASIISNFYTINEIAKEKDANLTQFLDYANCYDSMSKVYSYILGKDNYRAISANEGKNKADMSKAERLSRLPMLIKGMYDRTEITTPPIDRDYETSTGRKINVVLGNSTNMINLSYGERTNSCLRIGGAFNNLFEFCIHDKNGFHVRFTDPLTGMFISRVSGIRNGNTIFFNELRDSENPDYSNEDLIEVLNALSTELIEKTKDEECPIDNVVITYDYAMRNYEQKSVSTQLEKYPNAFYGLRFNIPFDGKFVLLKTTSSNGDLVPYEFGSELAHTYETQRDRVVVYENLEVAQSRIVQINLIDALLKGMDIEDLTYELPSDVLVCITGEDWYVYADNAGNVYQFLVENSKHKERALIEMKESLEKLKEFVNERQQEKALGGV